VYRKVADFDRVVIKTIDNQKFVLELKKKLNDLKKNAIYIIFFYSCADQSMDTASRLQRQTGQSGFNLSIQHYVLFSRPVKNITKVEACKIRKQKTNCFFGKQPCHIIKILNDQVNVLNNYLSANTIVDNLKVYDTFVIGGDQDTAQVYFNNPCSMYNYYKICQNGGVCKMSEELEPSCA
jgi:hypothetical protein